MPSPIIKMTFFGDAAHEAEVISANVMSESRIILRLVISISYAVALLINWR
jgi:hypothetical protein